MTNGEMLKKAFPANYDRIVQILNEQDGSDYLSERGLSGPREALLRAFVWEDTIEGDAFWSEVYRSA